MLIAALLGSAPGAAHAQDLPHRSDDVQHTMPERSGGSSDTDWSVTAGGEVLVGVDSNPAAGVPPDQREVPTGPPTSGMPPPPPGKPVPSSPGTTGYGQAGVRLVGEVGSKWWARGRLGWDYRQYFEGDRRSQGWLAVEGGWRSPSWMTRLTLQGTRYDDTLSTEDGWVAQGDAAVSRWVGGHGLIGAHLQLGDWVYDGATAPTGQAGGGAFGGLLWNGWRAAAGTDLQRRWSSTAGVTRTELVPWALIGYRFDWFDAEARYETYVRRFAMSKFDGAEHRLRVRVEVQPWKPEVALITGLSYGRARGAGQGLSYDRAEVYVGVSAQLGWQPEPPSPLEPTGPQGGASVVDGEVRFRVHRPDAAKVSVIGDFDGWDAERGALERTDDGWFEGTFRLAPGRHQYLWLVDGRTEMPEGAVSYAPDGFGGKNAVLVVPEPGGEGGSAP